MNQPTEPTPTSTERGASPSARLWTRPGLLACVIAAVIVYGSLIPFGFDVSIAADRSGGLAAALARVLAPPPWQPAGKGASSLGIPFAVTDVVVNLLLYIPLGVPLRMALRRRRWGWPAALLAVTLAGLGLSWGVESLQGLMPARYASLNDVVCNTAGALVGGLLAVPLWALIKRGAFAGYCRLAGLGYRTRLLLARPGVALALAAVNALVIGGWYLLEVRRSASGPPGLALPFERAIALPYDLGAVVLGQGLLVYAGIGCLLMLLTYTGARRLAMNWVVLAVVLLAFAAEFSRAITHNAIPDITGPLLALTAAAIMTVTVYTFSLAVKRMNRRHTHQPYEGPDRRRAGF